MREHKTVSQIADERDNAIAAIKDKYRREWNRIQSQMQAEIDNAERNYRNAMWRNLNQQEAA
jgi:vacuolar-type H+-ATPase subunit E/Vma4